MTLRRAGVLAAFAVVGLALLGAARLTNGEPSDPADPEPTTVTTITSEGDAPLLRDRPTEPTEIPEDYLREQADATRNDRG